MMTSRRSRSSRSRSGVFVGDVGLGLRMQNNKESGSSGSNKRVMVMSCHDHDEAEAVVVLPHHDQLSSSSCSACSCGDGGSSGGGPAAAGGPMFYGCTSRNNNNHVACFGDINDVVASASASSGSGGIDARAVVLSKSLQYHHPFNSDSSSLFTFNSSGEMTPSVNERSVLFTTAQWQELERQTVIYKYMMASVPVPPELLLPCIKNQSNMILPSQSNSSRELGVPSFNSSDPEPWRCKRTDGKKWRCSRDVAPDQKYCERHSHKSRPRSRKPVELQAHDSMRTITNTNTNTTAANNNNNYSTNSHLFDQKSNFPNHLFMLPGSYDQPRSLEWLLKGETSTVASNSSQEWQHLKRESIKLGDDKMYDFRREEQQQQLRSNLYRGGGHSLQAQRLNDHCSLLLSPTSTTLERALNPPNQTQAAAQETRHFIDAWSTSGRENNIGNKSSVSSTEHHKLLPHPALTLSMSGCGGSETKNHQGNENDAQVGGCFGIDHMGSSPSISDISRDHHRTGSTSLRPQWMMMMNHGGSGSGSGPWMMSSPPGGPLAEALCLGISSIAKTTTTSNLESPCSSNSDPPNINKN